MSSSPFGLISASSSSPVRGDLAELCELVPTQIQNAGALYGLMKIFSDEDRT